MQDELVESNNLLILFRPLSSGCWIAILLTILMSIIVQTWLERNEGDDLPADANIFDQLLNSLYFAFIGMTSGASVYSPKTRLGKILAIGFSFYAMLVLVVFASNTTSNLTVKNFSSNWSSSKKVIESNLKICSIKSIENSFKTIYPASNSEF